MADLEDVFLDVMGVARHDRLADPVLQGNPALLESGLPDRGAPVLTAVLYLLIFGHVLEDHVKVYGRQLHRLPGAGPGDDERAAERFANSSSSHWCRARSWAAWCLCC
jgi:hypothetical protein